MPADQIVIWHPNGKKAKVSRRAFERVWRDAGWFDRDLPSEPPVGTDPDPTEPVGFSLYLDTEE
jgi:hypothetical protein